MPVRAASSRRSCRASTSAATANDAVAAGLSLMGVTAPAGTIRLERGQPTAADSAWARTAGHVLLVWPASESAARVAWSAATGDRHDRRGGVGRRRARRRIRAALVARRSGDRALGGWRAGSGGARRGRGCIRDVGVVIDDASDITLRASFGSFTRALLAPCGGARSTAPIECVDGRVDRRRDTIREPCTGGCVARPRRRIVARPRPGYSHSAR